MNNLFIQSNFFFLFVAFQVTARATFMVLSHSDMLGLNFYVYQVMRKHLLAMQCCVVIIFEIVSCAVQK
jgi:hypothetical protein